LIANELLELNCGHSLPHADCTMTKQTLNIHDFDNLENVLKEICRIHTQNMQKKYAEYAKKYAEYAEKYAEYAKKYAEYAKKYAEYAKKYAEYAKKYAEYAKKYAKIRRIRRI
jgi:hypothetical protein